MTTRLLLVDDHAVVRSGLRMLFENEQDMEIVGEADTASGALEEARRVKPDVILMDIGLPDMSGIDATRGSTKAALLICHGGADQFVSDDVCWLSLGRESSGGQSESTNQTYSPVPQSNIEFFGEPVWQLQTH